MSNDQQPPQYPNQGQPWQPNQGQVNPQYPQQQPPVKTKKPFYKKAWFWVVIAVVVVIAIIAGTGSGSDGGTQQNSVSDNSASAPAAKGKPDSTSKSDSNSKPGEKLTLLKGWKMDKSDGFSVYVKGYVQNNTDETINNFVAVTFNVYNAAGNNIGTCTDSTETIDAKGKWQFSAICDGDFDQVKTVKFKELTGF